MELVNKYKYLGVMFNEYIDVGNSSQFWLTQETEHLVAF